MLDILYRKKWTPFDGLGALIISPTRELAVQIFEVLRSIGGFHAFSAGLVIGGKNLKEERDRLSRMNILVCTPGRMLQHMDQTAGLEANNLQILVLDEADRILDMGFRKTVDAIIENLPKERQTLLFSATQTKNVSDLARLSLKDPEYVAVHETAESATPANLSQNYLVVPLHEKLDTLYSFLRMNLKAKIVVFLSSCKQVRFVYETFRHLKIGIPLLHLHGKQKQTARAEITARFSAATNSCLFATDVVARGLDFPAVDWVVQLDCPEDADTYIHRVGRTARYQKSGRAILFLLPSEEEGMVARLAQKKIPIEKTAVKASVKQTIQNNMQAMCFKDPELKYLGQKCFTSYVKSIALHKDKTIFKVDELPLAEFASSLGLPGVPQLRLKGLNTDDSKKKKNMSRQLGKDSDDEKEKDKTKVVTRLDRMFNRKNQNILTDHYQSLLTEDSTAKPSESAVADEEDDDDAPFLKVVRRLSASDADHTAPGDLKPTLNIPGAAPLIIDSHRREKLLHSKKALAKYKPKGTKLVFDEEGQSHQIVELVDEEKFKKEGDVGQMREEFIKKEKERAEKEDVVDRALAKEKRREKKEKRKRREREEMEGEMEEERVVMLGAPDEESEEEERPAKKRKEKKWFEEEGPAERKRREEREREGSIEVPDNLADLEAMAEGLLG